MDNILTVVAGSYPKSRRLAFTAEIVPAYEKVKLIFELKPKISGEMWADLKRAYITGKNLEDTFKSILTLSIDVPNKTDINLFKDDVTVSQF